MPAYRFEVTRGDSTESFEVECDSFEHMRDKALRLASLSIGELQETFWGHPRWALRVSDETNMTILSLTFSAD
jgi:hypothetical protein